MTPYPTFDVAAVATCIQGGGVVLLPTDTVYGLAVSPLRADAVERLLKLKNRPITHKLPIMLADPSGLEGLGAIVTPDAQRLLASEYMPGPMTLALGVDTANAPPWLSDRVEFAIRIPAHDALLNVLKRTGPLFVTSANYHGKPTPNNVKDVLAQLDGAPDMAIDTGILNVTPSTLINCNMTPTTIEREGMVKRSQVESILE